MPDRYQESHIRQISYFANLPEPVFQKVAQTFVARRYNPGEIIFSEGETTRGMHIFVDGQAVLLTTAPNGGRQQLGLIRAGQSINDQAIFRDGTQTATLQAVQPVTALLLTRQAFTNLIAYNPDVAQAFGYSSAANRPKAKNDVRRLPQKQFKTQRENEEVLLITRRHWWAYARWAWLPLLIFIGALALAAVISLTPIRLTALFLGTLIPAGMLLYLYAEWSNDSIIITDQRVIRITHTILTFTEVVNELALESVQEVNAEVPSLSPFALLLSFGDVELKTAGREGNFMLDFVPNPDDMQELILEDQIQRIEKLNDLEKQEIRAEVDRWLSPTSGSHPQMHPDAAPDSHVADEDKIQRLWSEGDGPLSPFANSFPTDNGGIVYRKHWIIWLSRVAMPSLVIFATLIAATIFLILQPGGGLGIIGLAILMVSLLVGVLWFYFADWDWRHDYYLVTDTHINIIYQRPLWLQNENDQVLLKQVDNVVAETRGLTQRLLGFGDVKIALVGADQAKVFDDVSDPLLVQGEISRRQAMMRQREEDSSEQQQREILSEYFKQYHESLQNDAGYRSSQPQAGAAYPDVNPANPQPTAPNSPPYQPTQNPAAYQPQPPRYMDRDPAQQSGYPQQQGGYQQPGYPQQNPSPQQHGYPPQQPNRPYQNTQNPNAGAAQRPARPTISNGRRFQPSQPPARPPANPQQVEHGQGNQPPPQPPQPYNPQRNPSQPSQSESGNRPGNIPRRRPPSNPS